ncbi:MAG TPA: WYL domain-containing protein [Streptosporangiaceae bacterium]|nr:WYL domain-containing protein [Streptosporangiaceae bacterium]
MSKQKTERLLSLVVCLLSSRRYLTAGQIRDAVPGYPDAFEAFKRMFERDKDELRELGIPLETGTNPGSDEEVGYRISRQAYELPEIMLEPDEAAVLGLAARVWQRAELAGAAAGGLLKLRAAGIDAEVTTKPGIEPRLATEDAAFGPLWRAVRDRRPVTFSYLPAGRTAPQPRHLEPWGVVNRNGNWYVAGFDTGRQAERVFRLSRIAGTVAFTGPPGSVVVPPGTDVRKSVSTASAEPPSVRTAELRVRRGTGYGLRRRALTDEPWPEGGALPASGAGVHWDLVRTTFSDVSWYADYLASFGADVVVLEPVDLRDAVIRKLKGVLA